MAKDLTTLDIEELPVKALFHVMNMRHKIQDKTPNSEWIEWLDEIEIVLRKQREINQKFKGKVGRWKN